MTSSANAAGGISVREELSRFELQNVMRAGMLSVVAIAKILKNFGCEARETLPVWIDAKAQAIAFPEAVEKFIETPQGDVDEQF